MLCRPVGRRWLVPEVEISSKQRSNRIITTETHKQSVPTRVTVRIIFFFSRRRTSPSTRVRPLGLTAVPDRYDFYTMVLMSSTRNVHVLSHYRKEPRSTETELFPAAAAHLAGGRQTVLPDNRQIVRFAGAPFHTGAGGPEKSQIAESVQSRGDQRLPVRVPGHRRMRRTVGPVEDRRRRRGRPEVRVRGG